MFKMDSATVSLFVFVCGAIFTAGGVFMQIKWLRADVNEIKTNHLAHLQEGLDDLKERVTKLEARF